MYMYVQHLKIGSDPLSLGVHRLSRKYAIEMSYASQTT